MIQNRFNIKEELSTSRDLLIETFIEVIKTVFLEKKLFHNQGKLTLFGYSAVMTLHVSHSNKEAPRVSF